MSHTLVLLRHAKSAYPPGVSDHDRPLSDRGWADAAVAGQWIRDHVGIPELVLVSTAVRAQQTWQRGSLALEEAVAAGAVRNEARIYDASVYTLLGLLQDVPEAVPCALVVGHNPGIEQVAHLVTATADPDAAESIAGKYATCGTAVLTLPDRWSRLRPHSAHLDSFVAPRATSAG